MPQLKEELEKAVHKMANFDKLKDQVDMTVTPEGLRVELLESETGTFFDSGSSKLNGSGKELLQKLAEELGKLPNKISIEGHTDSRPFSGGTQYGNWELSADRANAARRLMQQYGLRADQVSQVRGYADQNLRKPQSPEDASNRRISVIVRYVLKDEGEEKGGEKPSSPEQKTETKAE